MLILSINCLLLSCMTHHWEVIESLPSYGRGIGFLGKRYRSLITGQNLTDVVITGDNETVDGQGSILWEWFKSHSLNYSRPNLVELINSNDIIVLNLSFINSPTWNIHPIYCSHAQLLNITVRALADSPYTDGIVPGRLREGPSNKLIVECTGEGIMFIEADANVRLNQFGDVLQPPFPGAEELIYNVPGSDGILHCPILLMQVTRLVCGGFIVGCRYNHTMIDGTGFAQFMTAVAEIAQGASVPSVKTVWNRELLMARNPPRVTCVHHVYDESYHHIGGFPPEEMVYLEDLIDLSFFFSLPEIASLKNLLPSHLQTCSKYEILSTCIWQCRTVALNFSSSDNVRFVCVVNARAKLNPPLPAGYYGNALGQSVAPTTVGELCQNPLGYALELVKKAKADVTDEFMKSTVDYLVINGRPNYATIRTFEVSDIRHLALMNIDFGWGKQIYSGPIASYIGECFFQSSTNKKGEDGILSLVCLPRSSMERFTTEVEKIIREANSKSFSSTAV